MTLSVDIRHRIEGFTLDAAFDAPGGVTALFGPSGAGKTTLARAVAGLLPIDAARIAVGDRVLSDARTTLPPQARRIGYVFQEPRLFPHLSVRANLLYGAPAGADPAAMAAMLDIANLLDRRPGGLSGGEAARVAIGRALLRDPDLLILDEPLAALDATRRAAILPYLERMRGRGTPILYISHAMDEVVRLADTLVLLDGGRVVRAGPVAEVLADPGATAALGPGQVGTLLDGRVTARGGGLATVETAIGALRIAADLPGDRLRFRIRAEDVTVAITEPTGLSARNVMAGRVASVEPLGEAILLGLSVGQGRLLAQVTPEAVAVLDLAPGREIWAIVKASGVGSA
ncbi:molybdenum ABC transporter ATP-binding protein [uncultured Jannaschia sp.]|uniref:molybdenum ABC transporter ATP-binding protein n=1 Tax=uncultured Jannaschia sp. TaxID=293347 RepID=UPI00262D241C|nr:molybdenum ABC transporter ATP-binding protein [uncultured Jannaschia sp.]